MNRKERVYAFLRHQATVPLTKAEIAAMLEVPSEEIPSLSLLLEELVCSGKLTCHKGRFSAKEAVSDSAMLSSILAAHDFPEVFPPEALAAADAVPTSVTDVAGREDFRSLLTFTIDGVDARDFDDAISILETEDGFRLYVHIADVSHYVKERRALDREAFLRGTSCYLPNLCIPMLPPALSNGICSLNPEVDRLTLTTRMDISHQGKVTDFSISEAVIRSDFRLNYTDVSRWLAAGKADSGYKAVFPALQSLEKLTHILVSRQKEKGSIDFGVPEPQLAFDEKGRILELFRREEGIADKMIEVCMILCNRTLAEYVCLKGAPFVYRVHEAPDKEKLGRLRDALGALGLSFPGKFSGTKAAALLESAEDETKRYIVSMLLLRTMMKARYSHENTGHFGLSLPYYCHFTSPIRRYPDLVCHRIVKAILHGQDVSRFEKAVRRCASFSSVREEAAAEAEREAVRYLICRYMEPHIGESYTAIISSVLDFGFFVMLPNLAEGLVHVRDLGDDYYIYDEKSLSLTGRQSGTTYRLGDRVTVELARVDATLSRIDFTLKEAAADGKNNCTE